MKIIVVTILICMFSATIHAALIDRGNGLIYDTDLDITWLQDANYTVTAMTWDGAMAWANTFVYQGYSDWRLPTSGINSGYDPNGEMGHLYYTELENPAGGPLINADPLSNIQPWVYWSNMDFGGGFDIAYGFHFGTGAQVTGSKSIHYYAMAVRDGDVATVPEPGTLLLLASGFAGIAIRRELI